MSIKKNSNEFVFPADSCLSNFKIHKNVKYTKENPKFVAVILFPLPYFTIEEAIFFLGRRLFSLT